MYFDGERMITARQIDYSKKWYTLIAVAIGTFLATLDIGIVNIALPILAQTLRTDFSTVQWVVLAYLLTITALVLSVSRAADLFGKKPLYVCGFILFSIGSLLCGISPTIAWLIGFRVIQAIGASMIMALGMAILTEAFPPKQRGKALGILGAVISVGIVAGPFMGGILMKVFSWRGIFLIKFPIGIAGVGMALKYLYHIKPPRKQAFDVWGALTLAASLLCLCLGLTFGQELGFGHLSIMTLLSSWLLFLWLFIGIELRAKEPMVDFSLFKNPLFGLSLFMGFIGFIAITGTVFLMPFYLRKVLGLHPFQMGLLLSVMPLMMGIVSPVAGAWADRFGSRLISVFGFGILMIGFYSTSTLVEEVTPLGYILRLSLVGIGMGIFQTANNSSIMGAVPRERLAIGSGLLTLTRTIGQIAGTSVIGTIWGVRVGSLLRNPSYSVHTPVSARVKALDETFLLLVAIVGLTLLFAIWNQRRELREALSKLKTAVLGLGQKPAL